MYPTFVFSACVEPVGNSGNLRFDSVNNKMLFCDGANWHNIYVGALCDANNAGNLRYNDTDKILEFCNGTEWKSWKRRDIVQIIAKCEWPNASVTTSCPPGYTIIPYSGYRMLSSGPSDCEISGNGIRAFLMPWGTACSATCGGLCIEN